MVGAVQYNVASTTGLADNFPRVFAAWPATTYKWASTVMYTWGGGFFLIAGVCYVLLDMGLPGLWLGMFCLSLQLPTACSALHAGDVMPLRGICLRRLLLFAHFKAGLSGAGHEAVC